MSVRTKVFNNGRSQAVRIPAAYRFTVDEVLLERDEKTGDLILRPCPREFPWDSFFSRLDAIPEAERADFLKNRGLVEREEKDIF